MLSFLLMLLNAWAAWSCASVIVAREQQGLKVSAWTHVLGAANVFFVVVNGFLWISG